MATIQAVSSHETGKTSPLKQRPKALTQSVNLKTQNSVSTGLLKSMKLNRANVLQNNSMFAGTTSADESQLQQSGQGNNLVIQPSRYGLKEKLKPMQYQAQKVLVDLENKVEVIDTLFKKDPSNTNQQKRISLYTKSIEPIALRIKKPNEFKLRPLRRVESDFQMFKDIFVQPQQVRLTQLNQKEEDEDEETKFLDSAEKFFHQSKNEALLQQQIQKNAALGKTDSTILMKNKNDKKNIAKFNQSEVYTTLNNSISNANNGSLKDDLLVKNGSPQRRGKQDLSAIANNISILEQSLSMDTNIETQKQFFDQLIQVQPPDLPNATIASPVSPGNGYAPSIPLVSNFDESGKNMVKDLMVRAKAGQQAGDVQKEAHLSFYLGMVFDNQKKYHEASKYYLKFFTCAHLMEDKIGMGLGANRIGCDYFHTGQYEKSIEFHQKNIQYSDSENAFAGFYNLGIAQRKNENFTEAIANFKTCLKWTRERDELESECLSLGQLAVTYESIGETEEALFNFTDCYEISKKLRKVKLQLDCLLHITKLLSMTAMRNSDNSIKVLRDAVDCAKLLEDKKTASLCLCNLGIMEGNKAYDEFMEIKQFQPSIEEWNDDQDEQMRIIDQKNLDMNQQDNQNQDDYDIDDPYQQQQDKQGPILDEQQDYADEEEKNQEDQRDEELSQD